MALGIEVAGKTDVGSVRANNEDNFGYDSRYGIFVVCDGMGGQAAGEVASKIGVDTVLDYVRQAGEPDQLRQSENGNEGPSALSALLTRAIRKANQAVLEAGQRQQARAGMGATVVAALIRSNALCVG